MHPSKSTCPIVSRLRDAEKQALEAVGVKFPCDKHGSITQQLRKHEFRSLGYINGWDGDANHPSEKFYREHKASFKEVFSSGEGYHLAVSFEQRAYFETDSGD